MVQSGHGRLVETLRQSDHARVGAAEWQVPVVLDELVDPYPIGLHKIRDVNLALGDRLEEQGLGSGAELPTDQVGRLGDDQPGRDDRARRAGEQRRTRLVRRV